MRLDILVKPTKEGKFTVECVNIPNSASVGTTVEEAAEIMIEKIADSIANDVRDKVKQTLREQVRQSIGRRPIDIPFMMTNLPISLN
jgi:predicted RNase H-like HicB family nuclease